MSDTRATADHPHTDPAAAMARDLDAREAAAVAVLFPPPGHYDKSPEADQARTAANAELDAIENQRAALGLTAP
jgi:membrane peptidoglycan carboxypeptidase